MKKTIKQFLEMITLANDTAEIIGISTMVGLSKANLSEDEWDHLTESIGDKYRELYLLGEDYNEYKKQCNRLATEFNQNYLSEGMFKYVAKEVGVEWEIAKGWVNGEY